MAISSQRLRAVVAVIAVAVPQWAKRFIYRRLFGWDIHPTARFGLSYINVDKFSAAEGAAVAHLNVIKGCDEVRLGVRATIGPMNWITSPPRAAGFFSASPQRRPGLVLGDEAAITTRHILYCSDEVIIEPYAILGGLRSLVVTHGPDYLSARQLTAPVRIGHHSIVAASSTVLAGTVVPPCSIVAAGSTVAGCLGEDFTLYGGTPARKIKKIPEDAALFYRERGVFD